MTEIVLINTRTDPIFLSPDFQIQQEELARAKHHAFVSNMRTQLPTFGLSPYLALLEDNWLHVPMDTVNAQISGVVGLETLTLTDGTTVPLDEFVDALIMGEANLPMKNRPLKHIVEFSRDEIHPYLMRKLRQKYDIDRIQLG